MRLQHVTPLVDVALVDVGGLRRLNQPLVERQLPALHQVQPVLFLLRCVSIIILMMCHHALLVVSSPPPLLSTGSAG